MKTSQTSRRSFIQCVLLAGSAPLLAAVSSRSASAADLPPLTLDNPTAKALAYVESTDGISHPAFKPGSLCSNCQFIQGNADDPRRPCSLFPGYTVASKGWCSAWAKLAS